MISILSLINIIVNFNHQIYHWHLVSFSKRLTSLFLLIRYTNLYVSYRIYLSLSPRPWRSKKGNVDQNNYIFTIQRSKNERYQEKCLCSNSEDLLSNKRRQERNQLSAVHCVRDDKILLDQNLSFPTSDELSDMSSLEDESGVGSHIQDGESIKHAYKDELKTLNSFLSEYFTFLKLKSKWNTLQNKRYIVRYIVTYWNENTSQIPLK